jgi:hypothetical protein
VPQEAWPGIQFGEGIVHAVSCQEYSEKSQLFLIHSLEAGQEHAADRSCRTGQDTGGLGDEIGTANYGDSAFNQ